MNNLFHLDWIDICGALMLACISRDPNAERTSFMLP